MGCAGLIEIKNASPVCIRMYVCKCVFIEGARCKAAARIGDRQARRRNRKRLALCCSTGPEASEAARLFFPDSVAKSCAQLNFGLHFILGFSGKRPLRNQRLRDDDDAEALSVLKFEKPSSVLPKQKLDIYITARERTPRRGCCRIYKTASGTNRATGASLSAAIVQRPPFTRLLPAESADCALPPPQNKRRRDKA